MTTEGGTWKLKAGESVVECINPWLEEPDVNLQIYGDCAQCFCVPYKVMVIRAASGQHRRMQLCGRHFIEACHECSLRKSCKLASGRFNFCSGQEFLEPLAGASAEFRREDG